MRNLLGFGLLCIALSITLSGCDSTPIPTAPPQYNIGDKVIFNDQIGQVMYEPSYSSGLVWTYTVYCRNQYLHNVPESSLGLRERINWNETPMDFLKSKGLSLPDLFGIPHGGEKDDGPQLKIIPMPPYNLNKTTYENSRSTLQA